jgi:hypothetical protein
MHTSSWDLDGSSTLLKNVSATTLAMSTLFEVPAMESLIGWLMNSPANERGRAIHRGAIPQAPAHESMFLLPNVQIVNGKLCLIIGSIAVLAR